jgi:uncharacterized membrane protein YfcA
MTSETLLILSIFFASTFVHSTVGFGGALIAVPLMTMVIGLKEAAPLATLGGFIVTISIAFANRGKIHRDSAKLLMGAAACGIVPGVLVLKQLPEFPLRIALAVLIIGFATYLISQREVKNGESKGWTLGCGFAAGLLGGAYAIGGPPLVVYGAGRRWEPAVFRATLQAVFIPMGVLAAAGHGMAGLITPNVLKLFVMGAPVVVAAIIAGGWMHRRIPAGRFDRITKAMLLIMGITLLIGTLLSK